MTSATRSDEFYDRTAEYVGVLLRDVWTALGPAVTAALSDIDPAHPLVDIGAGVGDGTAALAQAFPEVPIIAIEPNPALRTALLVRVSRDPALTDRVTIIGRTALDSIDDLPETVSGFVLANVLGHFTAAERYRLWELIAARLAGGARAIVTLAPPTRPELIAETPMSEASVGRFRYTGTAAAEPTGPDAVTWTMRYTVHDGDTVRDRLTASDIWYVLTPEQLTAEAAEHGLHTEAVDPQLSVWAIRRT
ncbi:class I SAM-dependent methyltransferase [Nocardia uniformis]|uniref:Class I SAM-dependent methyltransferase n=1 Tax=Nocardia uniformis TaxID=53432 RepID=A0A849BNV3_9NOCA|nr:hypothetical protein [Nocardia uniformis]NNH68392.1 class I SAM-dependent methyltransferase [Nocardia uniformis]